MTLERARCHLFRHDHHRCGPFFTPLSLARGTEKCRAVILHDALDNTAATGPETELGFPAVDLKRMLKISYRAVRLPVIVEARAACGNGFHQNGTD